MLVFIKICINSMFEKIYIVILIIDVVYSMRLYIYEDNLRE